MNASVRTVGRRLTLGVLVLVGAFLSLLALGALLLVGLVAFWSLTSDDLEVKGPNAHSPTWSPDGTRIAYVRDRQPTGPGTDIWIVQLRSGATRNVSRGPGSEWDPAFSPDGNKLVVSSDRDRHKRRVRFAPDYIEVEPAPELYVIDLRTGHSRRLTSDDPQQPRIDERAVWSSDGSQIAWIRGDAIWAMRADGRNRRRVYSGRLDPSDPYTNPPYEIRWSTRESIEFTAYPETSSALVVYRLELTANGRPRPVVVGTTHGGDRLGDTGREVYASSDDSSVEVCSTSSDCFPNTHLVVADGTKPRALVRTEYDDTEPRWSPSGDRIAFARGWEYKERYRIYVTSSSGRSLRPVTP